MRKKD